MDQPAIGVGLAVLALFGAMFPWAIDKAEVKLSPRTARWIVYVSLALLVLGLVLIAIGLLRGYSFRWPFTSKSESVSSSDWPLAFVLFVVVLFAMRLTAFFGQLSIAVTAAPYGHETEWAPPTAKELLGQLDELKQFSASSPPKLKIVATDEGKPVAREFVEILKYCGLREFDVNQGDGSYIFPSREELSGTRIRFRDLPQFRMPLLILQGAVGRLIDFPNVDPFPDTDDYNFIQIEIGKPPDGYSAPVLNS